LPIAPPMHHLTIVGKRRDEPAWRTCLWLSKSVSIFMPPSWHSRLARQTGAAAGAGRRTGIGGKKMCLFPSRRKSITVAHSGRTVRVGCAVPVARRASSRHALRGAQVVDAVPDDKASVPAGREHGLRPLGECLCLLSAERLATNHRCVCRGACHAGIYRSPSGASLFRVSGSASSTSTARSRAASAGSGIVPALLLSHLAHEQLQRNQRQLRRGRRHGRHRPGARHQGPRQGCAQHSRSSVGELHSFAQVVRRSGESCYGSSSNASA
jgi:hypothetical protein